MSIAKYVKDMQKAVFSLDIKNFKQTMDKHGIDYSTKSDKVLKIAMYKMALAYTNCPNDVRQRAGKWLEDHGYSKTIY